MPFSSSSSSSSSSCSAPLPPPPLPSFDISTPHHCFFRSCFSFLYRRIKTQNNQKIKLMRNQYIANGTRYIDRRCESDRCRHGVVHWSREERKEM
ncbi:hypothetical protein Bca101_001085 [Brassica carinata]